MKKLLVLATAAVIAAALLVAAPAPASNSTNPWPGKKFSIAFYVETVTASPGESPYGKAAPGACMQTNFFARGERAVWHIAAINARTGRIIEPPTVRYAYIRIPGMSLIPITYVPHGKDPTTAPWTWNARWDIPPDYPLGKVPFEVVFKLKGWPANKVATFTQIPIGLENMTIIDHR